MHIFLLKAGSKDRHYITPLLAEDLQCALVYINSQIPQSAWYIVY